MELVDLLDEVTDRKSFVIFVEALIDDRIKGEESEKSNQNKYKYSNASEWENIDISSYLSAALAWFRSSEWQQENPDEPSWKKFAEFLYVGKIYE